MFAFRNHRPNTKAEEGPREHQRAICFPWNHASCIKTHARQSPDLQRVSSKSITSCVEPSNVSNGENIEALCGGVLHRPRQHDTSARSWWLQHRNTHFFSIGWQLKLPPSNSLGSLPPVPRQWRVRATLPSKRCGRAEEHGETLAAHQLKPPGLETKWPPRTRGRRQLDKPSLHQASSLHVPQKLCFFFHKLIAGSIFFQNETSSNEVSTHREMTKGLSNSSQIPDPTDKGNKFESASVTP